MPMDPRQYSSAIDFISDDAQFSQTIGNMSNNDDKIRLKAYELYEDYYYNRPEHIRVVLRGEDDDSIEIYIPSAKKCIEAINRFLGVNFNYFIDPDSGDATSQSAADTALTTLFKNEKVLSKYNQMKRHMLIKGDACFHVVGFPAERPGKRIKIMELKPEHFFPIEDLVTGYCMGCHIVDIIRNPRNSPKTKRYTGQFVVRRQTYRKLVDNKTGIPTGRVTSELSLWEIGRWDDRTPQVDATKLLIEIVNEEFTLPPEIIDLPVYHWKNSPPPGSTFGMSECAGVESIITAINQAMTDEDLTLITQGLGVYWTDASPPVDEFGNETEWEIGPGSVVQTSPGGQFNRVSGISTVSPYLEHVKMMDESMQQSLGVPDIAIGMVDVNTAESGIALNLKLGPMLAKNAEKELLMVDETDEFFYDLINGFFPAYEKISFDGVLVTTQFGDPMPVNQKEELEKVLEIWTQAANTLPVSWLYDRLNQIMGYDLDVNSDFQEAIDDATKIAGAAAGPTMMGGGPNGGAFGDQLDQQLGAGGDQLNGNQYDFSNVGA
jgi:hypothetical protein